MSMRSLSTGPSGGKRSRTKPCRRQRTSSASCTRPDTPAANALLLQCEALSQIEGAYGSMRMRSTGTCMSTKRRSYETGHKPKCLVIVDDTAEWDRAVYYAGRWAMRAGGGVVMLRIIETEDQNQQWLGVADIMRAEALEDANAALDRASGRVNGIAAITPERAIREGDPTEQMIDVIEKDVDIAMLVLAASPGPEGPGPIISAMANAVGSFPIPVVIV